LVHSILGISASLRQTAIDLYGDEGVAWFDRLPDVVAECARRWALGGDAPFPNLTYNYAAPAVRADGAAVVLKVCFPDGGFHNEVDALQVFAGRGAVQLLAVDRDFGVLLLERLVPGAPLTTISDNQQAMTIAARVMRQLWRPEPEGYLFPPVADWLTGMAERAAGYVQPAGPFPAEWLDRALATFAELSASPVESVLLHGDLHQGNILSAEREPWLAIDPKCVVGEPACETEPLLRNALPHRLDTAAIRRVIARRVDCLADELEIDRDRIRAWGVVRAILSAFWSLEDHGRGWERALSLARVLAEPAGRGVR